MTGALLELVAVGGEDVYLIGNPQVSFFKRVYMRHTNFAIERVDLYNDASRIISINESKTLTFNFEPYHGDLLYYTSLHIKLPEIYAEGGPLLNKTSGDQFRWVEYLGENLIEEASLIIDDEVIETIDSLYIHIANHENLNQESLEQYHKMIGKQKKNYLPSNGQNYPYSSSVPVFQRDGVPFLCETGTKFPLTLNKYYTPVPTIEGQELIIPLPFFFNKFKFLYLPLVNLRETSIKIQIKIRRLDEVYTIGVLRNIDYNRSMGWNGEVFNYNNINQEYQTAHTYQHKSPKETSKNIMNFVKDKNFNSAMNIKLYSYLIFLDKTERDKLTKQGTSWTIQTPVKEEFLGVRNTRSLLIGSNDLISRFHFVARRSDMNSTNQWMNFSIYDSNFFSLDKINTIKLHENWDYRKYGYIPLIKDSNIDYYKSQNIITNLEISYNGNVLDVYNKGLYNLHYFERDKILHLENVISYNFSEKPELYQPSGHLNLNKIDKFNLNVTCKNRVINDKRVLYNFDIFVYLMHFKTITFNKGKITTE